MGRRQLGLRGLRAYLVEIREQDGETTVPEDFSYLVRRCIEDKIFSENQDNIAVHRSDSDGSEKIRFVSADWDGLKEALKTLKEVRTSVNGGLTDPIGSLQEVCDALIKQSKEDSYEDKKVIFFSNLSSYILDKDEVTKVAEKMLANEIFVSIVLPNKSEMKDIQLQNSKALKCVFGQKKFHDVVTVTNLQKARRQILNTQSKKQPRPTPWNVQLEISPDIIINVGGYVCTRKTNVGQLSRVLVKQAEIEPGSSSSTSGRNDQVALLPRGAAADDGDDEKADMVELAKYALEKEQVWKTNDGTVVDPENIGRAYYFGDKLVPFNALESEGAYETGEKCLKLLAFVPVEKINSAFHAGDGTTLFYPSQKDAKSVVKFNALVKAMANLQRVAVVRKVFRKNTKVVLGSLYPDEERMSLVFSELFFADDVSIPQLPQLIKQDELEGLADAVLTEKDELIDKLIRSRTLSSTFCPIDGPTDPAVALLRGEISRKVLKSAADSTSLEKQKDEDNLQVFFHSMIERMDETLIPEICGSFPLEENKVDNERFAGKNIFRKRAPEEELVDDENDKKPKLEVGSIDETAAEREEENGDVMDDLLDEF